MLKKEWNEIWKQSIYLVIFLVGLPLLLLVGSRLFGANVSYLQYFFPVFQLGFLIFTLIAGISLFTSEHRQDGIEYLLTLPMSRLKLLALKIFPRLAMLIAFSVLYLLLVQVLAGGADSEHLTYALPANILFFMICSLFITAAALSASHHNFVVIALLGLVVFSIYGMMIYLFSRIAWFRYSIYPLDFSSAGLYFIFLLILPLPLFFSFILSFKKFDVGPGKSYNRLYLKFFVPFLVIGLLLSFFYLYSIKPPTYKNYLLTGEHKLLEETYFASRIFDEKGVHEIDELEFPALLLEHGGYIYANMLYSKGKIFRVNMKDYRVETFYSGQEKMRTRYTTWRYGDTIAVVGSPKEKDKEVLLLVHSKTKAAKEIILQKPAPGYFDGSRLFGADEIDGERYWLITSGKVRSRRVMRVWEDGRGELLTETVARPVYFNHMLITTDREGMVFSKITREGLEEVKRLPQGKQVRPLADYRQILDNEPVKEMYGRVALSERVLRIDLETFETNWIPIENGYVRYFYPCNYYCVTSGIEEESNNVYIEKISMLKGGKLIPLKDFGVASAFRHSLMSKWGFCVEIDGKVTFYTLPECKELSFKGVN